MKRFSLIATCILLTFMLVAAACSQSADNSAEGTPSGNAGNADNGTQEQVTIKLFSSAGQFTKGNYGYTKVMDDFMKKNPNIKVEISQAHGKQWTDTFLALASTNELPDVISGTGITFDQYVANKWVQPLNGLVSDSFLKSFPPSAFQEGINQVGGKVYATPRVNGKTGFEFLYNKDIMQKAGLDPNKPPETWDELEQMAKQVKEKTGLYPLGFGFKVKWGWNSVIALAQAIQPTLDITGFDYKKGQYDFSSPAVIQAFQFIQKLNSEGLVHPDSLTLGDVDFEGTFANKQVAFGFGDAPMPRVFKVTYKGLKDYGISTIPTPTKGMKYHEPASSAAADFYISATTKHPKEAAKLVEYLGSNEYLTGMLQDDLLPVPLTSLMDDPKNFTDDNLKKMVQIYKDTVVESPNPAVNPGAVQAKQIEATLPAPKPDWWEAMQGAYLGQIDIKQAMTQVTDAYNKRFNDAIKKAKDSGANVTPQMFTFPDWDGTKDYKK